MTSVPLRHGIFVPPFHTMGENPALCLRRDLELVEHVDRLGFAEAWIGEHHSAGFETIGSPELFIAAAAERTTRIRLGTGVVSLPYHNPLNVANRILQLDHQTFGRVMFGGGPGLLASDAHMLGIDQAVTRARMAEALDVILRLFRGEWVTEETEWYSLHDAHTHLRPYSHPYPETVVASAYTPSGGRIAGKYGLGMLCLAANDPRGFDALDTNWKLANEVAAEHGNTLSRENLRVVMPIHLASTREQARENIRFGLKPYIDYMNNNLPRMLVPDGADPVDWVIENRFAVVGTPDDAIERIDELLAKQGDFGCLLTMATNWADWEQTKRSYELYARYVIPHFAQVNTTRRASYAWVTRRREEFVAMRTGAAQAMFDEHEAEQREKRGAQDATSRPQAGREAWAGL